MVSVAQQITDRQKKKAVVDIRPGDTVRVHQKIREGGKERIQVFEGLVIRASRKNTLTSSFTVRRIASGIGVEKSYLIHSPNILKVEIVRRAKVRRNYKEAVNAIHDEVAEAEEERIHDKQVEGYDPEAAKAEKAAEEAEAAAATVGETKSEAEKIEEQPKEKPEAKAPAEPQNKE
jgi:large subunit ribosomal protein L19